MRQDLHRHFIALGLSPGASSNDIRIAYRCPFSSRCSWPQEWRYGAPRVGTRSTRQN